MSRDGQYIVLEWVHDIPGFPRYSIATVTHAEELWPNVQWLQLCPSLETAARTANELNQRDAIRRSQEDAPSSSYRMAVS